MKKRGSFIVYRLSFIVLIILFAISFVNISHARTTIENLSQVEILFMEGKYERVVSAADKLIDAGAYGREELFYLKGLSQLQLKKPEDARRTFDRMIERYPAGKRPFDGYIGIGDSYFSEGKYAEAIASYNSALSNYPDHKNASFAHYKTGLSYRGMGMQEKAQEYFDRARRSSPLSFESRHAPKAAEAIPKAPVRDNYSVTASGPSPDTGDYFYVQAGYFKSKTNARKFTEKLSAKGYESYMSAQIRAGLVFYKVKIGRFKTKAEADAVADKLKADGYKTRVCR